MVFAKYTVRLLTGLNGNNTGTMANQSKPQSVTKINTALAANSDDERTVEVEALRQQIQSLERQNIESGRHEKGLQDQLAALHKSIAEMEAQREEFETLYNNQRTAETRYRELFDLAPVGYISLSSEGIIDKVNLAAIWFLKIPGSKLINTAFSTYLTTDDQLKLHEYLMLVASSHLTQTWVANVQLPDGSSRPVQFMSSAIRSRKTHKHSYQIMIVDISQQLNNEKLLRNAKDYLEEMAHQDPLTKLPNRTLFTDNLQSAIDRRSRDGGKTGVIYFDLDGFKPINDSLGHAAGDNVLKEVASRVSALLRPGDSMARLGGDEFTVIMDNPAGADDVVAYAQAIAERIREPFKLDEAVVRVSSSIGISLYPDHAVKIDDLVKGADAAMYQAKQAGRDQVVMFTRESLETSDRQSVLETSLVHAVRDDQLILHYQPIYDVASLKVVSVEALVRWEHPTLGLVSPGEFIPLAEKTDQIVVIGQWVLETACQQARAWQMAGIHTPIAINVSGRQLVKPDYASNVSLTLARHGLSSNAIEIEITETAVMLDDVQCAQSLQQLKEEGHMLAIDDFGTGHSSLGRLAHLPVSRLKIDRIFIADMGLSSNMRSLIRSIIVMSHELGLQVVSEGIECQEQLEFLAKNHCDAIQGYMMSRPEPAADITKLLAFNAGANATQYQSSSTVSPPSELLNSLET